MLLNVDQRTNGFIKTYELEHWSLLPSAGRIEKDLQDMTAKLLRDETSEWASFIKRRDEMYTKSMKMLREALS